MQLFIDVEFTESEEEAEDNPINRGGAASDEEDGSGLVGACVTEYVEDTQKAMKCSSLSSYMLKTSRLITHLFDNNRTA